jgi:hypothetical protein
MKASLKDWEPGLAMTFYNSRNFYSDGAPWNFSPGSIPWVCGEPDEFVKLESWMVLKRPDPRMVWSGWSKSWDGDGGEVRAVDLLVHSDDVHSSGRRRKGVYCFKTSKFQEAGELLAEGQLEGIAWAGDFLDISFKEAPLDAQLERVGWKRLPNGDAIDTHTPLGSDARDSDVIFPGHDPSAWRGVEEVSVDYSGKEGCVPASFTITIPERAEELSKGLGRLPKGCKVSIEKRWHWANRVYRKGECVEFSVFHCPPIKANTSTATLRIERGAGRKKSFVVGVDNLDFSKPFRPVVGVYHGPKGGEKCLITARCDFLKQSSVASRERLTHLISDKGYRVISPNQKGGLVSRQKMYGAGRLKRLPKNNPQEFERLVSLYGDVVPYNYYDYRESDIAEMQKASDTALSLGFLDWDSAAKKSIVPSEVFRALTTKGVVEENKLYQGRFFYKPITARDIECNPQVCREIVRFAAENGFDWLCQLCAQHASQFKRAIVESTFSS